MNVVAVNLPPLRKRKEDIPFLADFFIKKYSKEIGKEIEGISKEALDLLIKYDFPGNVRELENMIERGIVLTRENFITKNDLPQNASKNKSNRTFDPCNLDDSYESKVKMFESAIIKEALTRTNGNKSAAARLIGITERHLRSRMERLSISENE